MVSRTHHQNKADRQNTTNTQAKSTNVNIVAPIRKTQNPKKKSMQNMQRSQKQVPIIPPKAENRGDIHHIVIVNPIKTKEDKKVPVQILTPAKEMPRYKKNSVEPHCSQRFHIGR
jgi:hypothetical protein